MIMGLIYIIKMLFIGGIMEFKIVVKALILDKNALLLVKRSKDDEYNPNELTVPGGFLDFGEKLNVAVKREVKEETNLEVEVQKINTAWSFIGKEKDVQIIGISFLCKLLTKEIKLNEELLSYKWININNYKDLNLPKWLIKEIEQIKVI